MCGLVGAAGNIYSPEKKMFRNLLLLDRFRGEHSTGVAAVNKGSEIFLHKQVGPPDELLKDDKVFDKDGELREFGVKAIIGHNRYATVGAKTADNAHPFRHGNIVGAHNGTLRHLYNLADHDKFQVDSEAIFYNIDRVGIKPTVAMMNGAWALTWYNKESDTMNFLRNNERPLYYCYTKYGDVIFWASTIWALESASMISRVDITDIHEFKENHHYTLELKGGGSIKNNPFTYSNDKLLGFTPPVVTQSNRAGAFYGNFYNQHQNAAAQQNQKGKEADAVDPKVVERMTNYIGKDIEFFTKSVKKDVNGLEYVLAESVASNENWDIRLYTKDKKKWELLSKDKGSSSFTAIVKKVVDRWEAKANGPETYMLLDLRTLSEPIVWMKDNEDFLVLGGAATGKNPWLPNKTYTGYKGVHLTHAELVEVTRHGCDWCCEDAENLHKPEDLLFIGPKEFICPTCNADGQAAALYQYIN